MAANPGQGLPRRTAEHAVQRRFRSHAAALAALRVAAADFDGVLRVGQHTIDGTEVGRRTADVGDARGDAEAIGPVQRDPHLGGGRQVTQSAALEEAVAVDRVRRQAADDFQVRQQAEAGDEVVP
jgi:hypothetical protein